MDDPRQQETPLKYEVFSPPFEIEIAGFTRDKEYPIYEERVIGGGYRPNCLDSLSLFTSVTYRTINDDGKLAKAIPHTVCNLRETYKQLKNHTPFEEYMALIPIWRVLAGLTKGSLDLTQQLKEMDKELESFMRSADWMRDKIQEVLRRRSQ